MQPPGATASTVGDSVGKADDIDTVLRQHAPRLERQIARLLGHGGPEVTDLLQTTFVRAVAAYPRFRGDAPVVTWLSRIAINVVRDHFRSRATLPATVYSEESVYEAPAGGDLPDGSLDRRRQLRKLGAYLEKVSPPNRIAFVLHVIDGLSLQEVADLCEISAFGAKSRVYFARRYLMKRLKKDPLFQEFFGERREGES